MKPAKILVVDDSPVALLNAMTIIRRAGKFDLIDAKDGEEAVAKATAEKPDLIIMDVVMPKMSGFEACRAIRDNPWTRSIPIILVTTRGEAHNREEGYASGCNEYITKPFSGRELVTMIEELLSEES